MLGYKYTSKNFTTLGTKSKVMKTQGDYYGKDDGIRVEKTALPAKPLLPCLD